MSLVAGSKFALLAVENVYADLPHKDTQLSDGTWVLQRIPVEIETHWMEWIGSLRAGQILGANVVLLRTVNSANPLLANDDEQHQLTQHLIRVFSMLQLGGVAEYDQADVLAGGVMDDGPMIRHMSRLPKFHQTKGYSRQPITLARLETAVLSHQSLGHMEALLPGKYSRFMRGLNILKDGLQHNLGQERIHQFLRSLEALVLPQQGSTQKQVVHRCQTFALASPTAKDVLDQAYDMRSDAEHVQDWNRALSAYPVAEREDLALQRTRQMEALSRFAYSRILLDKSVAAHFEDDTVQEAFWKLLEKPRIAIWGKQLDLSAIPLVTQYDSWNRAI
jgi:hypothetical protein